MEERKRDRRSLEELLTRPITEDTERAAGGSDDASHAPERGGTPHDEHDAPPVARPDAGSFASMLPTNPSHDPHANR
jgi:hypothetical protein